MIRIALSGATGRMGQTLQRAIEAAPDMVLTGGIAAAHNAAPRSDTQPFPIVTTEQCASVVANADAIIDFSTPDALQALLRELSTDAAALTSKAIIVGTTGLTAAVDEALNAVARSAAVVTAANFSVGVNLLLDLVTRAAAVLDDRFDIEIVESHHRRKVDAPSGTALALARAAATGRGVELESVRIDGRSGDTGARPAGQIALHAIRGGSVVGEHRVNFMGDVERIEISHVAVDRVLFADGALTAARWALAQKPGRYTMRDVLGL